MRPRERKYESLLFFNLGFCSVLLLVGLGACRPQLIRNADRSYTILNLSSAQGRLQSTNESRQITSSSDLEAHPTASTQIVDAFAHSDARRFALASLDEREAGLGYSTAEAENFALKFGSRRDGTSVLNQFIGAFRFFVRAKDVLSSPQLKGEAISFADRVSQLKDSVDVTRRYNHIFDLAVEKGLSKGRAFNLADRFQPLENADAVAEKFMLIFDRAKNGHLDEELAVKLAEKYSGAENGENLIEQWLGHFNSQQGRMPREQAVIAADAAVASQVQVQAPQSNSSPDPIQETVVPVQIPQEYAQDPNTVTPPEAVMPFPDPMEGSSQETVAPPTELHGSTF